MIFVVAGIVAAGYWGWKMTSRSSYESAPFNLLESEGAIELREYPDLILATTHTRSQSQGNDGSFMRLFNYISGGNQNKQKVAMTTPVFMEPSGPDRRGKMGFVIPSLVANRSVPEPLSKEVQLQTRSGGRFAVIRFSGRINSSLIRKQSEKLKDWIQDQNLIADGNIEVAGYDAPWTPGPFRRNELMVRLKPSS